MPKSKVMLFSPLGQLRQIGHLLQKHSSTFGIWHVWNQCNITKNDEKESKF